MANPNNQSSPRIKRSEQYIQNASFDEEFQVLALENLEFDGSSMQRKNSDNVAVRTDSTTTANTTYIGSAPPGTATSSASWQIFKIDTSSGTSITWADGDSNYNNVWDNRASLSYS